LTQLQPTTIRKQHKTTPSKHETKAHTNQKQQNKTVTEKVTSIYRKTRRRIHHSAIQHKTSPHEHKTKARPKRKQRNGNGQNIWDGSLESSRHSTLTLKFPPISPLVIHVAIGGLRDGENATIIINVVGVNGTETRKVKARVPQLRRSRNGK